MGKSKTDILTICTIVTFLSGASALMFETLWLRSLSIVLGSTVYAAASTFSAFMVGLAVGAVALGKWADSSKMVTEIGCVVEFLIAILAAAAGFLLHRYGLHLAALVPHAHAGLVYGVGVFLLVLGLIGVPTFFMGAAFPVLIAVAVRNQAHQTAVTRLYFINTLGGGLGTLFCAFITIRFLGVSNSILMASSFNACAALVLAGWLLFGGQGEFSAASRSKASEAGREPQKQLSLQILASMAFLSGFATLALEVIWTNFGNFFVGNRTYAVALLLAAILTLLAVGSLCAEKLKSYFVGETKTLYCVLIAASAIGVLLSLWAFVAWIRFQPLLEAKLPSWAWLLVVCRFVEALMLLAPFLIPLGCLFPLALATSPIFGLRPGFSTGTLYLSNCLGAVIGSLSAGFFLIPKLGSFGTAKLLLVALLLIALWAMGRKLRVLTISGGWRAAGAIVAAVTVFFSIVALPERLVVLKEGESLVLQADDEYGVFQIAKRGSLLRVSNNNTDLVYYLGLESTSFVQQMQAHLGMFFNPSARSVIVIGNGYGITAGAFSLYPGLTRIDTVEILPSIVRASDKFEPYNFAYHKNPRVNVFVDDGRHFLARAEERYDIITVNVTDAHLPGAGGLFHKEFYELTKSRLKENGILIQHSFGDGLETILATILSCFNHVQLYRSYGNGFNVMASQREFNIDEGSIKRLLANTEVGRVLSSLGFRSEREVAQYLKDSVNERAISAVTSAPIATDDYPRVEFAWSNDSRNILYSNE